MLFYIFWQLLIVVRYQFLGMVLSSVSWLCSQMKSGFLVILDIFSLVRTHESVGQMEHGVEWKQFAHVSLTLKDLTDTQRNLHSIWSFIHDQYWVELWVISTRPTLSMVFSASTGPTYNDSLAKCCTRRPCRSPFHLFIVPFPFPSAVFEC